MIEWLFGRWRAAPEPGIATRMTEEEVVAVARTAVGDNEMDAQSLANPFPAEHNGAIVWTVSSMVMGSSVTVEVDDATGAVISRLDHYGR